MVQGLLACLVRRGVTGKGGRVEVSLLEEGAAVANRDIWFPQANVLLRAGLATEIWDARK